MAASVNPADVRAQMTRTQKARWRKGFPAAPSFTESRYTVSREGNEYYAYCDRIGEFFVSTTPQLVFDAIRFDMNSNNITGALIHIKTGTITGVTVTLDRDNTILEGEGWQTFLVGTAGSAVYVTGDGCVIRDLGVRSTTTHAIEVLHGYDCRIENVWVWQAVGDGLHVYSYEAVISQCLVQGTSGYGIYLDGGESDIKNNYIMGTESDGIKLAGVGGVLESKVSDNYLYYIGGDGIDVSGVYNVVQGNVLDGIFGNHFIHSRSANNTIHGNQCMYAYNNGILIDGGNNIISDNNLMYMYGNGIVINSGCDNTVIKGNKLGVIHTSGAYGIYVNPCSGVVIGDNIIHTVACGYGIRIHNLAYGCVVNCNRLDKTPISGIWLSGSYHAVTGNFTPRIIDNSLGSVVQSNMNMSGA